MNMKKIKFLIKHSFVGSILLYFFRFLSFLSNLFDKKLKLPFVFLKDSNNAVFFGYHDKTPFSKDNTKILAMSVNANDKRADSEGEIMKIGYFTFDLNNKFKYIELTETTTWCWQQGCMLQWNPKKPNEEIIFNKIINGDYGSIIYNINSHKPIQEFEFPIYAISPCGNIAASLNFSRLGRLRPGYGYTSIKDSTKNINAPIDDGIFIIDLNTGKRSLILSLYILAKDFNELDSINSQHYVNHLSFSPNSNILVFFHIIVNPNGEKRIRFLSYNFSNKKTQVIEESKIVSHFCWKDNCTILVTTKDKACNHWEYLFYNICENSSNIITGLEMNTDGHPMCSPLNNSVFVLDSRLNMYREDSVLVFSTKSKNMINVATFNLPYLYEGQVRCDLHPRWDRKGDFICVDTVHKNKRTMAIINVKSIKNKL